jgi:hypothetical protein
MSSVVGAALHKAGLCLVVLLVSPSRRGMQL